MVHVVKMSRKRVINWSMFRAEMQWKCVEGGWQMLHKREVGGYTLQDDEIKLQLGSN